MRAFVFMLLAITTGNAAPQGSYNYHAQVGSSLPNEFSQDQFQFLQKYSHQELNHQQQKPQVQLQLLEAQGAKHVANSYHFQGQLAHQTNLPNYEHEELQQEVLSLQQPLLSPPEQQVTQQKQTESALIANGEEDPQKKEEQQFKAISLEQPQTQPQPQPESQHKPQQYNEPQISHHKTVQYNKEFYYLSAPKEDFGQPKDLDDHLDSLRKNIRVVFIRAPENNNAANAALQLAKQSLDQQTVVYVLTKQHDASELVNKLHQIRASSHSKPDVVFIKYRTPEEAEQAQRTIQAQYEELDGPNYFNHEGVAPTHNFIGFTPGQHTGSIHIDPRKVTSKSAHLEAPSPKYLPANAKL